MTKPTPPRAMTQRVSTGMTLRRILAGIAALVALLALMVGMPLLLWAVRDIGTLHIEWTVSGVWRALLRPDDGTLFLALFKLAGWITWAILVTSIVLELVARIRHVRAPNLRGLGIPQALARSLVTAVAALFLTTGGQLPTIPVATADPVPPPPAAASAHPHTPQPGHTTRGPQHYTVRKGDTLSGIALDKLGDAHRYPEIFRASRDIRQPGGHRLTDPDVIDIGWTLNLPSTPTTTTDRKPDREDHHQTPDHRTRSTTPKPTVGAGTITPATPSTQPTPQPTTAAPSHAAPTAPGPNGSTVSNPDAPVADADEGWPVWLLTGLAGAGGILAGTMWLALRRRRALQSHHRRPGFMIAPPPADTIPVEKTLRHAGAPIAHLITVVDDALRRTAETIIATGDRLPAVQALEVTDGHLIVHLAEPGQLPAPWQKSDTRTWQLDTATDLDAIGTSHDGGPSPWPHLVTLGTDQNGHCWLVNLEAFGTTTITGDPTFAADLARYWAAELATSPWAQDIWQIDLVGVFGELDGLHPAHIRVHTNIDEAAASVLRASTGILKATADDPASHLPTARMRQDNEYLPGCAVFAPADAADGLSAVARLIHDKPGRTGTTITFLGPTDTTDGGLSMNADTNGRVRVPALGLDLFPTGITADEALGCVQLLKAADQHDNVPVPAPDGDNESITDAAGRLHHHLTEQRPSDGCTNHHDSNLPQPDNTLLTVAATTPQDLATLAPVIPPATREQINTDPTLDDDLAAWHANSSDRPRLAVLGPVRVRVGRGGDPHAGNKRKAYYTEIVAYLATRHHGATTHELCDALATTPDLLRRNLSTVRKWLGTYPATHDPFLPDATRLDPNGDRTYRLTNLLHDADLFRRLRIRGQTRGPDGLADYLAALNLVTGTPYTGLRATGGIWLADNRDDQHLLVGIVDVAHLATTMALAAGELDAAEQAARIAAKAAPDEDRPRVDLAAVVAARGRHDESQRIGGAILRQNDNDGPLELDDHTIELLLAHGWLAPGTRAG
ncbi:MAG: hypothetical protein QM619_09685 [Micropruina sp.]|uniref:hypothetical protein n=1 Tax=Micropruina sp. TaxID=2737536 RepID=UPI0039E45AAE